MQGDKQILQLLNRQLTRELTAVNQYFLHARMYRNWGFERLGDNEYKLRIREKPREMLSSDLDLERGSQDTLKEGIAACETAKDYVSREILEEILEDTEEHIDWIGKQLDLMEKVIEANYLQSAMGDEGKS